MADIDLSTDIAYSASLWRYHRRENMYIAQFETAISGVRGEAGIMEATFKEAHPVLAAVIDALVKETVRVKKSQVDAAMAWLEKPVSIKDSAGQVYLLLNVEDILPRQSNGRDGYQIIADCYRPSSWPVRLPSEENQPCLSKEAFHAYQLFFTCDEVDSTFPQWQHRFETATALGLSRQEAAYHAMLPTSPLQSMAVEPPQDFVAP